MYSPHTTAAMTHSVTPSPADTSEGDDLDRLAGSLITQLQTISQAVQAASGNFKLSAAVSELKTWQEDFSSAENELDELWESIQQTASEFEQELTQAQSELDQTYDQAKDSLAEIAESITALEETVTQTRQETEVVLTGFTNAIAQLQSQVESFQSAIEADFEALSGDLTDVHTTAVEAGFGDLIEQVSQTQLTQLSDQFSHFSESMTALYSTFNTEVDGLGTQLTDRCSQMLKDLSQHCGEAAKSELETAFQDVIEDAIAAMVEEVIQSIVLMTVGSSITASISYSLPALVAAKKIAELSNAGLDALGL
ncbi:hypothetical protein QUA54_33270 [Microcoleus sp. MOSTC5]|uniref:hypothetical protein n=1 Tax=Microcoleus sp. MOSTC5 TaxID=3055378 RepID=UPI002FD1FFBC